MAGMAKDFWVFGYGSLMWRPGFDHVERHAAWIEGYHRALCVYSHVHRGTPDKPGLVLGLDAGGSCRGVAFRVAPERKEETLAYLRARELVTHVYHEVEAQVRLDDGRHIAALAYVVDQGHRQYAHGLDREETLRFVRQGVGQSGANADYVRATVEHMRELEVDDAELSWLAQAVGEPAES
jgi:cation transport protein ChaC